MSDIYSSLPEPTPLARAAILTYEWGDQRFEVICSACSLRTLPWKDTGESLTWLHCKAMTTAEMKPDEATGMMTVLIPAHYVTSIRPGPTFRISRAKPTRDVGVFPPTKPTPALALLLSELEKAITGMLDPVRN
jgi:hypothetical protein